MSFATLAVGPFSLHPPTEKGNKPPRLAALFAVTSKHLEILTAL
jgi:hypothetical protein